MTTGKWLPLIYLIKRAGINETLHRISAIKNRTNEVIGLTLRVGRAVLGVAEYLQVWKKTKQLIQ